MFDQSLVFNLLLFNFQILKEIKEKKRTLCLEIKMNKLL